MLQQLLYPLQVFYGERLFFVEQLGDLGWSDLYWRRRRSLSQKHLLAAHAKSLFVGFATDLDSVGIAFLGEFVKHAHTV